MQLYDIIMPLAEADTDIALHSINYIYKYLPCKNLIILGNENVGKKLSGLNKVTFMNEDKIIKGLNIEYVRSCILKRHGDVKRAGWYFQQFLKMSYANICRDDAYIIWDSDTIPLRKIEFKRNNNRYLFTIKNEYHKPYFDTIHKVLGYDKCIRDSFIAENMIIEKNVMIELIHVIESNKAIDGNNFIEKIINSINPEALNLSGFSEFETYGTFIYNKYPEMIEIRRIKAFRKAKYLVGLNYKSDVLDWFRRTCDTVSFEKSNKISGLSRIIGSSCFRRLIPFSVLYQFITIYSNTRYHIKIKLHLEKSGRV